MSRQFQEFFSKFAFGIAVSISLEAARFHRLLWIGPITIAFVLLAQWAVLALEWRKVSKLDALQYSGRYLPHNGHQIQPIDRRELINKTYNVAYWTLPAVMMTGVWLWFSIL